MDEDVARSVGEFLERRGHEVFYVGHALVRGSADPLLAQWVDVNEGIVVTHNYKHFQALVSRVPTGGRARFRKASRLTLKCLQTRALQRVMAHIESIEWEYAQCQSRPDKRLMCDIGDSNFVTNR